MEPNIEHFIRCASSFADAKAVIFGAPYDSTTSYRPGARFGSAAIRHESFGIETFSPYQDKDLDGAPVFDSGDVELPFGAPGPALDLIERRAAEILDAGKLPVMLGGEHLVTLGAIRALSKRCHEFSIVHFDAHADLREDYLGNTLSHATVMRRCLDLMNLADIEEDADAGCDECVAHNGGLSFRRVSPGEASAEPRMNRRSSSPAPLYQFGIRSGTAAEFAFAKSAGVVTGRFALDTVPAVCQELARAKRPVYVTVDLDVLDPSAFPGTGTPEAGGVAFDALRAALMPVLALDVVGFDMVELAPSLDPTGRSTALACKLLRECLLKLA